MTVPFLTPPPTPPPEADNPTVGIGGAPPWLIALELAILLSACIPLFLLMIGVIE